MGMQTQGGMHSYTSIDCGFLQCLQDRTFVLLGYGLAENNPQRPFNQLQSTVYVSFNKNKSKIITCMTIIKNHQSILFKRISILKCDLIICPYVVFCQSVLVHKSAFRLRLTTTLKGFACVKVCTVLPLCLVLLDLLMI